MPLTGSAVFDFLVPRSSWAAFTLIRSLRDLEMADNLGPEVRMLGRYLMDASIVGAIFFDFILQSSASLEGIFQSTSRCGRCSRQLKATAAQDLQRVLLRWKSLSSSAHSPSRSCAFQDRVSNQDPRPGTTEGFDHADRPVRRGGQFQRAARERGVGALRQPSKVF
jgi:hypothetical protein